jgi:hypothetical protein
MRKSTEICVNTYIWFQGVETNHFSKDFIKKPNLVGLTTCDLIAILYRVFKRQRFVFFCGRKSFLSLRSFLDGFAAPVT